MHSYRAVETTWSGGRFHSGGRAYRLQVNTTEGHHNHGFPMSRSWHVHTCRADEAGGVATFVFTAAEHEDVLAQFPHRFVLTLTYTLRNGALRCEAVVHNDGPVPGAWHGTSPVEPAPTPSMQQ